MYLTDGSASPSLSVPFWTEPVTKSTTDCTELVVPAAGSTCGSSSGTNVPRPGMRTSAPFAWYSRRIERTVPAERWNFAQSSGTGGRRLPGCSEERCDSSHEANTRDGRLRDWSCFAGAMLPTVSFGLSLIDAGWGLGVGNHAYQPKYSRKWHKWYKWVIMAHVCLPL
jgi:hypothetical protein